MATSPPRAPTGPSAMLPELMALGVLRVAQDGATVLLPDNTAKAPGPYSGSAVPASDGAYDLGSSSGHWRQLYIDYTNTATVGAVTINKAAGRAIIAAGQTSVVVTCNKCLAETEVMATLAANDATARLANVVPGNGFFTINLTVAATANCPVSFFMVGTI